MATPLLYDWTIENYSVVIGPSGAIIGCLNAILCYLHSSGGGGGGGANGEMANLTNKKGKFAIFRHW